MDIPGVSLVAQMVKNPPALWETWVRSPGWEDPLEEVMATHSSIFAWRICMDRGSWQVAVHWGQKELDTTKRLSTSHRATPWRGAWQPTPVLLPAESHGQRTLAGYIVHRVTESDTTEVT